MTITRRNFLASILALGAAPAIVRADALMRVVPVGTMVLDAADVSWSAVDFNRDTIKVVLLYRDDGCSGSGLGLYGPAIRLVDSESWPIVRDWSKVSLT